MNGRLVLLGILVIIVGIPVGLHAQSSYAVGLVDNGIGMGDSVSVVVVHSSGAVEVSLGDSLSQTDTQTRQAVLSKNPSEQLTANEQVLKDTGHNIIEWLIMTDTAQRNVDKPLTETLSLVESLSEVFVSNNDTWFWAVLLICIGAVGAGIIGAVVAVTRKPTRKRA